MDNSWESSGSSEGEYVESPPTKKPKLDQPVNSTAAPACLEYNQNEMSIVVKSHAVSPKDKPMPVQQLSSGSLKETESEAIICSPQIMFNIKSEPVDDDEEDGEVQIDSMMQEVDIEHLGIKMEIVDEETYEQLGQDRHVKRLPPPLLIPLQQKGGNNNLHGDLLEDEEYDGEFIRGGKLEEFIQNCKADSTVPPNFPPFILRNPRGNQTRTYTTDNLWSALMDVKGGESIYRASQKHKVPRKTLRNWMKRCQIKSAYPMPSQLKEAAEKKKHQQKFFQ